MPTHVQTPIQTHTGTPTHRDTHTRTHEEAEEGDYEESDRDLGGSEDKASPVWDQLREEADMAACTRCPGPLMTLLEHSTVLQLPG